MNNNYHKLARRSFGKPLHCSDLVEQCDLLHDGETIVFEVGGECPECADLEAQFLAAEKAKFGTNAI
jgi:hypothetical protein